MGEITERETERERERVKGTERKRPITERKRDSSESGVLYNICTTTVSRLTETFHSLNDRV